MTVSLNINDFLKIKDQHPVFDVRTPLEFEKGHIPGSFNLPLFSNEERAIVGTIYKKEGKEPAVTKGLELVGPKLSSFISTVNEITKSEEIIIYCWRGGMRSMSMTWLFETAGYKCKTIVGGYKSYRKEIIKQLAKPANVIVLGGMTGSGKTEILHELKNHGEQILDLEALANHKGSSFGSIGEDEQPSTEHFANLILNEWIQLDKNKRIWVEDESHSVGKCFIPEELWQQMRSAPLIKLDIPFEKRIKRLVKMYTVEDKEALLEATSRITKRLGYDNVKIAIKAINEGDFEEAASIILRYYDKAYLNGNLKRNQDLIYSMSFAESITILEIIKKADDISLIQNH